jgi:hypothetical protein
MAVRTAQNMTEAYTAKYLSAVYQAYLTAMESAGQTDYASFANDWVVKRDLTVDQFNASGESVLLLGGYLAFSSRLWKATKVFAGDALVEFAAVLVSVWVARGYTLAVLGDIRTEVYNIPAPPV